MQNKNLAYVSVEQKSNLFFKSFVQTCSDDDDETGNNMDDMRDDDCVSICVLAGLSVCRSIHPLVCPSVGP